MREQEVTLASGLSGVIRPWKTGDLAVFTTRKMLKQPGPAIEAALMRAAWVDTLDRGPYAFDGKPPWLTDILSGDLQDGIRLVRALTFGDYHTAFNCIGPVCGEPIKVGIPLDDLDSVPYSKEALAFFTEQDNRIDWEFPDCGKKLVYGLRTGASMKRIDLMSREHGRHLHVSLAGSVRSVDGVRSNGLVKFMADLSFEDSRALEDELERLEGGYKDEVDLVCEACGLEQTQMIRMKPDFFRPEKPRTTTDDDGSPKRSRRESPSDMQPSGSQSQSTSVSIGSTV
ncbi:MAG: hypothetical protein GTN69_01925 [Armatimonadetes bacterium]|nr:hypothetical protein [Armatimonadota bacterium]